MPKSKKQEKTKATIEIGIIGGSGLYAMPGLSNAVASHFSPVTDAAISSLLAKSTTAQTSSR
jgi:purine nucleoside phosphorylase